MTEQHVPNIYEALSAVMRDVSHVSKRDRNEHQRFMFRGIDAVMNACGPALRKHGVIAVPNVLETNYSITPTRNGGQATVCRLKMRVDWYGPAGDSLTTTVWGEAFDNGDKATAKAHSVAFRTAFLETLCLPTDEPDPDADSYEQVRHQQKPDDFASKLQGYINAKDWAKVKRGFEYAAAKRMGREKAMAEAALRAAGKEVPAVDGAA